MRNRNALLLFSALSLGLFSCQKENIVESHKADSIATSNSSSEIGSTIPNQYIVQLHENNLKSLLLGVTDYSAKTKLAYDQIQLLLQSVPNAEEIEILNVYSSSIYGFAAKLSAEQLDAVSKLPAVKLIERNMVMGLSAMDEGGRSNQKADQAPYGIQRTGYANGSGKRAYVIDSGIDLDHPDLNVNQELGKNFVNTGCGLLGILFGCPDGGQGSPDDDNGHGSHCAGTIAGKSNGIGVLGVAFNAEVVPVKVLNAAGTGSNSGVIQGVDYVANNGRAGDVANMSLGGGVSSQLDQAVIAAAKKGILFALAAGNDSQNSNNSSPARANHANIFTVSAMDANDRFASFSNFGNPPVDYCAPGVSVYSTYSNGQYRTLSGTSMAAPHVAGLLLLKGVNIATDGFVKNDPDGNADPIAHL